MGCGASTPLSDIRDGPSHCNNRRRSSISSLVAGNPLPSPSHKRNSYVLPDTRLTSPDPERKLQPTVKETGSPKFMDVNPPTAGSPPQQHLDPGLLSQQETSRFGRSSTSPLMSELVEERDSGSQASSPRTQSIGRRRKYSGADRINFVRSPGWRSNITKSTPTLPQWGTDTITSAATSGRSSEESTPQQPELRSRRVPPSLLHNESIVMSEGTGLIMSECNESESESHTITSPQSQHLRRTNLPCQEDIFEDEPEALIDDALQGRCDSLDLDHTKLAALPTSLREMSLMLKHFSAANNQLTSVPDFIGSFHHLRSLSLSHNQISVLPDAIGDLTALRSLELAHNCLSSLPQSIARLENLELCTLDFNHFVEFPCVLLGIKSVAKINIAENHSLATLPPPVMVSNLVEINLDNIPHLRRLAASEEYREVQHCFHWNNIYPDQVLDFLYIGSLRSVQTPKVYHDLGIRFVVTCGKNMQICHEGVDQLEVHVEDVEEQSLQPYFDTVTEYIESHKTSGGILVHCFAGLSRSASMILAYLMTAQHLRLDEAMELVMKSRPHIHPNKNFMNELLKMDKQLFGPDARPLDMTHLGPGRTAKRLSNALGRAHPLHPDELPSSPA